MRGLAWIAMAVMGCGTSGAGPDASADAAKDVVEDCTPFALIPDATEFSYDASDGSGDAGCIGDPRCPFANTSCDGGSEVYPAGTQATLPTTSGSDINCSGNGDICACAPLTCYCAYETPGSWYCPN
jgi:hypothetical protein